MAASPKILLYDIETSPIAGFVWRRYQSDLVGEPIKDWTILCFAWKWLDSKMVNVTAQDDFKGYKPGLMNLDDFHVVSELRDLFDQADVVVAHNGIGFDQKKARARMMVHGLQPPSPFKEVDTCRMMKRVAGHTSNRLDDLNRTLDLERKVETGGFSTWVGCIDGDPKAWAKMKKYNRQDVRALEDLYLTVRGWLPGSPSLNVIADRPEACPVCLGTEITSRGWMPKTTLKYRRFQCQSCGKWIHGNKAERARPEYVA